MQRVPPQVFILRAQQTNPEPETQSRDDLVTGLLTLVSQTLSYHSNRTADLTATLGGHEEPWDTAVMFLIVVVETSIKSIAEQNFHVSNDNERG
jgi:hypothetical protein